VNAAGFAAIFGVVAVVVLVIIPVVWLRAQRRRLGRQSVTVRNGMLVIDDGSGRAPRGFPLDRIGTVVALPKRQRAPWEALEGLWSYGGLLILDRSGHVVRHLISEPGSTLYPEQVIDTIPAPEHRVLDDRHRGAFKRTYPGALRVGQLWGPSRWAALITVAVIVLAPLIGFLVYALVSA
jgi:hypothetical protein